MYLFDSTKTLEHASFFLTCMENEHVFMNLVSLSKSLALTNFETWLGN